MAECFHPTSHNHYTVLGLESTATLSQIRTAYRQAALHFHPDKNKSKDATAMFQRVAQSFEVLSDADRKHSYDWDLRHGRAPNEELVTVCDPMATFFSVFGTRDVQQAAGMPFDTKTTFQIVGTTRSDLNGQHAMFAFIDGAKPGRITVALCRDGTQLSLKVENLLVLEDDAPQPKESKDAGMSYDTKTMFQIVGTTRSDLNGQNAMFAFTDGTKPGRITVALCRDGTQMSLKIENLAVVKDDPPRNSKCAEKASDVHYEKKMQEMDTEDVNDLMDELRSGKKTMDKLKRRFEIEDDSFMQWLQRKAVGTTTAAGLFAQPAEVPPPPEPVGVPRRRRNSDGAAVSHQKLQLSHDDKDMLISLLDKGLPRDVAYRAINALPDSEKFLLAESFIQSRFAPPKPPPAEKTLLIKNQAQSVPVFRYPRSKTQQPPPGRVYTFLVIGETGSGKTTLLDAFTNLLANQNFKDRWRWKLVDEDHMANKQSGASQTTDVTYYYVWDERNDNNQKCHVRIIDTPGFGDTSGIDVDETIVQKFRQLFESGEVPELDYILVVVKASEARWSNRQRYIHNRIEELFGKDARDRFVLMCTFADGGVPQCLDVLKPHMHWQKEFKFNNSALYADPERDDPTIKFFWDLGNDSVKRFLTFVRETSVTPMSLRMAREVLQLRQLMQARADGAMARIQRGIGELEYLHNMLEDIKIHESSINANEDYSFTEKVCFQRQEDLGPNDPAYQYCTQCNQLCCQSCAWPQGRPLSMCTYFTTNNYNTDGKCPVCKGCPRERHERQKYKEVTVEEERTTVIEAQKDKFEAAQQGLSTAQLLMQQKGQEIESLACDMLQDMQMLKETRERLDEIAFKKQNHSNVILFTQMIDEENKAKAPGFQRRIESLQRAKARAEAIEKMVNADNFNDLFPQYRQEIQEVITTRPQSGRSASVTNKCSIM
jgi:predicted Fe-S protein YdhL (DUF1289 family)